MEVAPATKTGLAKGRTNLKQRRTERSAKGANTETLQNPSLNLDSATTLVSPRLTKMVMQMMGTTSKN